MLPPSPPLSPSSSPFLTLQPEDSPPSPASAAHYRASPAFTFHAYSPPASPHEVDPEDPMAVGPPALSTKRASRLSAPFPTFLYSSEPPPVTARNKQRVRPSPAQLAELKALYSETAHPTREEREDLGRRIGMRYQSVTNWFQNQRSTAKKRGPAALAGPRVGTLSDHDRTGVARPVSVAPLTPAPSEPRLLPERGGLRSRMTTPEPASWTVRRARDDDGASGDDDMAPRHHDDLLRAHHMVHDDPPPRPRQRTDPVRDIIIAQAAARHPSLPALPSQHHQPIVPSQHPSFQHAGQQQQQHPQQRQHTPSAHLPLPLSGSSIMSSSFPTPSPNANAGLTLTLPPAPRTTPSYAHSRGASPPPGSSLVSTFQVSREPSPAPSASTNAGHSHGARAGGRGRGGEADANHRGKRSRPTPHQLAALRALHAMTPSPSIEERTQVGREIGMELGKVTNWFRNLRQTARKKERRAHEAGDDADAVHDAPSRKRTRGGDGPAAQRKRPRILEGTARLRPRLLDEDEDDAMSVSVSHRSTAFDTSSTVGSVDFDFERERDMDVDGDGDGDGDEEGARLERRREEVFDRQNREDAFGRHREGAFDRRDDAFERREEGAFDRHHEGAFGRHDEDAFHRHHEHGRLVHEYDRSERHHDPDHEPEARSELGTESDAAHEAVTPEPPSSHARALAIPGTPCTSASASSRGSTSPAQHVSRAHTKQASVDDAMLLLAFHGAQA